MSNTIVKLLKNETEVNARVLENELSKFNKLRPGLEQALKQKQAEYTAKRLLAAAGDLSASVFLDKNRKALEEAQESLESHDLLSREIEIRLYRSRKVS